MKGHMGQTDRALSSLRFYPDPSLSLNHNPKPQPNLKPLNLKASSHIDDTTRHDTTACDTTRFFASHSIKWISSHICSTTKSGRHDKKLRHQKSHWKRFLSCVAATVSRKLLKKTVFIGISPGFINL